MSEGGRILSGLMPGQQAQFARTVPLLFAANRYTVRRGSTSCVRGHILPPRLNHVKAFLPPALLPLDEPPDSMIAFLKADGVSLSGRAQRTGAKAPELMGQDFEAFGELVLAARFGVLKRMGGAHGRG